MPVPALLPASGYDIPQHSLPPSTVKSVLYARDDCVWYVGREKKTREKAKVRERTEKRQLKKRRQKGREKKRDRE